MIPLAHAADWAMGLPALVFLLWLGFLQLRDRWSRRKESNGQG